MLLDDAVDGWKRWGNRVWTYPEALLSGKLLFKDGKKWVQDVTLQQVANYAYGADEEERRLVVLYGTGEKDFVRFKDRFKYLCLGIWSRMSGPGTSLSKVSQFTAWSGERVYALIGFLQHRITPISTATEKEAFDRLLAANWLECENYPWETGEEFVVRNSTKADTRRASDESRDHETSDEIALHYVRTAKYSDSGCAVKASCEKGIRLGVVILTTIASWLKLNYDDNIERIFYGTLAAAFFCSLDSAECSNI